VSWQFAGATSIARGMPYFSTAIWILTPRIFLPPSMPRAKQLGAERQERLSMTTALGSAVPPQAIQQSTPQAEPGPASEQSVERPERDIAKLSDGPPLHAAKADTPDRRWCTKIG
jgi:hypothetical protein